MWKVSIDRPPAELERVGILLGVRLLHFGVMLERQILPAPGDFNRSIALGSETLV